jgi:uncharacterized cupin superfamily protein
VIASGARGRLTPMRRFNLFDGPMERDDDEPPGYGGLYARVSRELGARELALKLFELEPGQSICPYHYEYVEEWLVVLAGRPTVRHPGGEDVAAPGDAICFPAGPDGAHKVTNNGTDTARMIMFSDGREPSVAVYPDSHKLGIWTGYESDHIIIRRSSGVGYWDGEGG